MMSEQPTTRELVDLMSKHALECMSHSKAKEYLELGASRLFQLEKENKDLKDNLDQTEAALDWSRDDYKKLEKDYIELEVHALKKDERVIELEKENARLNEENGKLKNEVKSWDWDYDQLFEKWKSIKKENASLRELVGACGEAMADAAETLEVWADGHSCKSEDNLKNMLTKIKEWREK